MRPLLPGLLLALCLAAGQKPVPLSLIPKGNGDYTITPVLPNWGQVQGEGEAAPGSMDLRRVVSGDSVAVFGAPVHEPLVIRAEILPQQP